MEQTRKKGVDFSLLIPTLLVTVCACLVIISFPEASNNFLTAMFNWGTQSFGWAFILFTIGYVGLMLWFIFGPYAHKRLGEGPPDRSTFSWISLIFVGSSSATIVYWAVVEFFYYVQSPPFGAEPFSQEAYIWGSAYGSYHWGVVPFAQYAAMAVLFGFMIFVKKVDTSRVSTACTTVIGERHANGLVGKVFDTFYMTSLLVSGAGLSLGMSTPLVGTLIERVFGIPHNLAMDAVLIIIWTFLFTLTVYTGLQKGMKYIANFRTACILTLLAFIFLVGPTSFIIHNSIESIGTQISNVVRMSTYTDVLGNSGFPQSWTVFYWAFFTSATLTSGLYYGRISRGRTVRQVALGVCFSGAIGAMIFFWVMGNYSISVCMQDEEMFTQLMGKDPYEAILYVWSQLPLKNVVIVAFLFYAFISVWSYMQGISYTLSMVSEKGLLGTEEPGKKNRIFWCALTGLLALTLLFLGGLQTVKNAAVISAIPVLFLSLIATVALLKDMKSIWGEKEIKE